MRILPPTFVSVWRGCRLRNFSLCLRCCVSILSIHPPTTFPVSPPSSPCLCPVGPGPHVLYHLLPHFCAEPRAPTQGLSYPPWQMWDVSPGCPAQKCCMQTSYMWGEMDAVIYAFSFCLLYKEELRAASCQVLQGRSSSLGSGGTSPPRQGTALTPCDAPSANTQLQAACGWGEAGIAPKGKRSAERTLWAGENAPDGAAAWPGQQDLSGAGLPAACLLQGSGSSQGGSEDAERPRETHTPAGYPQHLPEPCAHSLLPRHPWPSTGQAGRNRLAEGWQLTQQSFV